MTIVHCIWSFSIGGAENMLVDIINQQAENNVAHLVVVNDVYDESMFNRLSKNVILHKFGRKEGSKSLWQFIRLNLLLLRLKPDVVHFHNGNISPVILPNLMKKSVLTVHSLIERILFPKHYERVVAISEAVRQSINKRYKIESPVVINGIDVASIHTRKAVTYDNVFRIVQVGRLITSAKGQDILIEALAILKGRGYNNVDVSFIGEGEDAEMLQQLTRDKGLQDKVHFLGLQDRDTVYRSMCKYDMLVHPSRKEGFGLTIAEAMIAMLPVAVSKSGGPYEVIDYGCYGLSFEHDNAEACADTIEYAMSNYDSLFPMIINAKDMAEKKYSISRTVDDYMKIYRALQG